MCIRDRVSIAILHPLPVVPGHILLFPKKHYTIFENIPDYEVASIFKVASKLSIVVFEGLGAEGTNVMLTNGIAAGQKYNHVTINIIPRKSDDGINFSWKPKHLSEEEMSTVELKLREHTKNIGAFEKEEPKPVNLKRKSEKISGREENYLIRQLRRIP